MFFVALDADGLIAATPDAQIRYTTDGADPTASSALYKGPVSLSATTTIKAIAARPGERTSAVAGFTFTRGRPPPRIADPAEPVLPGATVGKPYRLRFRADTEAPVVWDLAGHLQIDTTWDVPRGVKPDRSHAADPCGLRLDPAGGELSGTPTAPGVYTFQVQCAAALGMPADARVYVLVVR